MYDIADHKKIGEFARKRFGNTYTGNLMESLKTHIAPEVEQTDEFVPLLNTRPDQKGEPIYLDLSYETLGGGTPIVVFAVQGSGKTVFILNFVEELIKSNYTVVNLSDVKNDAYYATGRLQSQFRKFLPPWKWSRLYDSTNAPLEVKCYTPEFAARNNNPLKLHTFQLDISNFSADDIIKSFFKLRSEDDPQARIIRRVYNYVFKNRPPSTVMELMNAIQNVNNIPTDENTPRSFYSPASIHTLNDKIDLYRNEGIFGEQYSVDFIQDMLDKKYVSFCLNNETRESAKSKLQAYISALIWKIYREKVSGRLKTKKIVEIFDDASEIAYPPRKIPSSKSSIQAMTRIGRDKWIFPVVISQSVTELGRQLINKARYVIFFTGISGSDLEFLAKERMTDYGMILDYFEQGKGPQRIQDGEYAGARSVLIWVNDGSHNGKGKIIRGWVGMPSCSIPLPKMGG